MSHDCPKPIIKILKCICQELNKYKSRKADPTPPLICHAVAWVRKICLGKTIEQTLVVWVWVSQTEVRRAELA